MTYSRIPRCGLLSQCVAQVASALSCCGTVDGLWPTPAPGHAVVRWARAVTFLPNGGGHLSAVSCSGGEHAVDGSRWSCALVTRSCAFLISPSRSLSPGVARKSALLSPAQSVRDTSDAEKGRGARRCQLRRRQHARASARKADSCARHSYDPRLVGASIVGECSKDWATTVSWGGSEYIVMSQVHGGPSARHAICSGLKWFSLDKREAR